MIRALLCGILLCFAVVSASAQPWGPYGPGPSLSDTPTGATNPQTRANRFAQIINVLDYGDAGTCNGTEDDTAAIQAAINQTRTILAANANAAVELDLPTSIPGTLRRCIVTGSLDMTGIHAPIGSGNLLQYAFEGHGTQIFSEVSGAPVIDALGSNQIVWRKLHIVTDGTHTATYGIQIGRTLPTGSDYGGGARMHFTDAEIVGAFSQCAYYNFAGEETNGENNVFISTAAGGRGYCADGVNHFNITSAFVTETAPVDTAQSFQNNTMRDSSMQADGTGVTAPVFIANVQKHYLTNDYLYGGANATSCAELFNETPGVYGGTNDLRMDTHCEGSALATKILIDGTLAAPTIADYQLSESNEFASTALFGLGGSATTANLTRPKVHIDAGPNAPVFASNPNPFFIRGADFYFYNAAMWNIAGSNSGPSVFTGTVVLPGNGNGIIAQPATCTVGGPITQSQAANTRNWLSTSKCAYVLYGEVSNTSIIQLTSDGTGASNGNNCANLPQPFGSQGTFHIDVAARDRTTTANTVTWIGYTGTYGSPSNASTTAVTVNGSLPTPQTTGSTSGVNIAATPDTTNGCLLLKFSPPTGNTDLWDVVGFVDVLTVR